MTEPKDDTEATQPLDKAEKAEKTPADAKFPSEGSELPKSEEVEEDE